jgi:hypothetical protein
MSAEVNAPNGDVGNNRRGGSQAGATASTLGLDRPTVTYQVILRHLAKFRDGATALLDLFATHAPAAAEPTVPFEPAVSAPAVAKSIEQQPKSPLELRIERHMATVDQALRQSQNLNPERKKKLELPQEVRNQIRTKERTIHDIVGAELHFWSAAIENDPLSRFDQIEQSWVRRIIRLANIIGVDDENREHLEFLEDWASHEHS